MPLQCFRFPGNITVFLPRNWFSRTDPPVLLNGCKTEYFSLPAHPPRPDIVDERLSTFLEGIPMSSSRKADLGIAVSEVAMNAMTHDGEDPSRNIEVSFLYIAPRFVLVSITDTLGLIPDQTLSQDPTQADVLAKLPEHGRGLFIIKQIVSILGQHPDGDGPVKEILVGLDLQSEVHHEATSETAS